MVKNYFLTLLFSLVIVGAVNAQNTQVLPFDMPSQNALKYNRFLMNPAFSFSAEDYSYVSFYHRNQWMTFEDSPKTYFVDYSGKINDKAGVAMGLYQQKLGVFTNFGVMANYSYNVKFSDKNSLTLGFNTIYYNSGIDRGTAAPGETDPALGNIIEASVITLQPGVNLTLGSFDVGVYAENLVGYNITNGEFLTDSSGKTFTGHLMYTRKLGTQTGFFESAKLSVLTRGRLKEKEDVYLSLSSILDLPKIGWAQAGYDDYYGMSFGLGFKLSESLSLGYTYEKGTKDGISNLGTTHEIVFAYSFKGRSDNDNEEKEREAPERIKRERIKREVRQKRTPKGKTETANKDAGTGPVNNKGNAGTDPKTNQTEEEPVYKTVTRNFEGVQAGYYIVSNVYESEENLQYFINILKSKGISANYFTDPKSNLKYVYLKRYNTLNEAMVGYKSNLDNTYDGPIWILHVDKSL